MSAGTEPKVLNCLICGNQYKQRERMLLHLGCKHGLVNTVLADRKLRQLPGTVLAQYSRAKQLQLAQLKHKIKKEALEPGTETPQGALTITGTEKIRA